MIDHDTFFIGGQFAKATSESRIDVISPYTEEPIARFPATESADIDPAIAAARFAFDDGSWPRLPLDERVAVVEKLIPLLRDRLPELVDLQASEMGSIAREEIFGPVASLIPYDDEAEAVRIANDSPYGLSGAVFTRDYERGLRVARQVRTDTYVIDGFRLDLTIPFGGYNCSGIGRECGPEGIEAYLEYKSISLPQGFIPSAV